ncbi:MULTISPECIES: hypothetical protein [unclassified Acinetobacter]|uniref:hypothetical protein n=1 Tax=unclassified Acinetobacter TaxID=196816 RepID=UPI0024499123|nr:MULTISPECIES: hypothetical protein [unclassified Acinetobacter]MDH0031582.1 hypothetical protein [Acinetobacter sp. GD04021]MDH0887221.1 hypothetical protein [Acinetobacter sp. GD03873]MDH1083672.1 hypothetical protein [Acinetobacter sp. GD03983]MDH2190584.1 hypothetical protein [Acinetobacter sp. GD03645]MDH2204199.1 hypothetical protein [Acinetobacter sp. GD03647]
MPIDTVQEALHIRRKKNAQVFRNIARLWEIGQKSHNDQDLLDALHPWREDHGLRFFNILPYLLAITSISTLIFGYFLHPHIQFIWSFLGAFLTGFLAYLLYEPKEPLTQVINYLEQRMTVLRYGLQFQQLPAYLPIQAQPLLVMSRLKQYFPLFNRGTESNEITQYASTIWNDGITEHQVLLFQYHYISEMPIFQENNEKKIVKEIHKDLWGAFIFQMPALGVAVSNQRSRFFAPYTSSWQSSDILINQKLKIFGLDQHQLAKEVGPSMTLKLHDFFEHFTGDLIYHHEEQILCYVGEQNLFQTASKRSEIHDIPALRGHLRTMTMPQYQKFQQLMLNLIQ